MLLSSEMKGFFLFKAMLLLGLCGAAYAGSVTVEGMDREITINQAQSKVPQGKKVTDTSCTTIEVRLDPRYRCTVIWE
ncbi:hypothetical protein MITS9509_03248 [Synechococcus sp. MIT S9509]|nr:hypothetical protein MITS9504_03207 [Synechococcus sp. MIT S9504]KZR88649.1 hypothetical protein MITS9509_03248 [Synechococcus sp. MIT S9509]